MDVQPLSGVESLTGTLSVAGRTLDGTLSPVEGYSLSGKLKVPSGYYPPPEPYHGDGSGGDPYVTASDPVHDIYLPTRNKLMEEDLLIKKIHRHDIVNPSGGRTVYIANETEA